MPSGAGPDGRVVFSTVGRNPSDADEDVTFAAVVSTDGGVERGARKPETHRQEPNDQGTGDEHNGCPCSRDCEATWR